MERLLQMEEQPSAQPKILEGQHLIFLEEEYFLLGRMLYCYTVEGQNFAHCNILIKIKLLTTFTFCSSEMLPNH